MNLLSKFAIPVVITTLLFAVILGYAISSQIKANALARAKTATASYVQSNAADLLSPENFNDPDFTNQYQAFAEFLDHITPQDVIKIKVYNSNAEIIYSTSKKNIGMRTISGDYQQAMAGQVAAKIKPPLEEKDNIDLKGYKQIMEVYVPITFDGKITGVIETYFKLDAINENIKSITTKVLFYLTMFSLAILATILIILRFVILDPISELKAVSDKISQGDLNFTLPIMNSKDEINDLNEALKGVFAAIDFLKDEIKRLESKDNNNG